MSNYKDTLHLPHTDFPMKADLAKREPAMLDHWRRIDIYQKLRQQGAARKQYLLHDGPPYANGHIHLGHALNKTLKDIVMKSKTLAGFDTPYIPGWDCHGLPIELNVERAFEKEKRTVTPAEFRKACRDYAQSQMAIQREEFMRLGVFGDWDNPYMTMDFAFEADIVRALAKIIANGHVVRGSKPVHWCVACGSALAEAEVEYRDKSTLAIDVAFAAVNPQEFFQRFAHQVPETSATVLVPIWTTTPWTLPANQAVALNPNIQYALVASTTPQTYWIVAASLVETVMQRYGVTNYHIIGACLGEALAELLVQHPFLPRQVPIVLGDHVTVDAGTGAVHTAPAHGQDDYVVGSRYNLPLDNPVNGAGCFVADTPFFAGEHVYKVNEHIVQVLQQRAALLYQETIQHSYPHCWRHKTPLIFRATPQWFVSMEQQSLRTQALAAIDRTQWSPEWAQARIADMIVQRPDWCISRQRFWGTPLTLFVHHETDALHPNTPALMEKVADLIAQHGVDVWYELDSAILLGEEDAQHYRKITDTLDVWFDAGVSHAAVLMRRPQLHWPADMYLEGSDQYRGWFQSSLLTAVAMQGEAPYRMVLSHGFTVDAQGRKMSKSLGNGIEPQTIWNQWGADILRLWVASTDFRGEQSISDEILQRAVETYRRIRNTARFLLSNLFDFVPKDDILPAEQCVALDRWAIDRARRVQSDILQAYERFQFHQVSQKIHHFCAVDMGGFYLDIIKDRLYTTPKSSRARRSAQTAMYYILEALSRWLAPILSFTAEEIWLHMPWVQQESVFLTTWLEQLPALADDDSLNPAFWERVMSVRELVNRELEKARTTGIIGSGLAAEVTLFCDADWYDRLTKIGDEWRFVLITSAAKLCRLQPDQDVVSSADLPGLAVQVTPSPYTKCERCWHRRAEVGSDATYPTLCGRCIENIAGAGEERHYA